MGFRPFSGLFRGGKTFADAARAVQFPVFTALPNADLAAPTVVPFVFDAVFESFCTGIVIYAGSNMLHRISFQSKIRVDTINSAETAMLARIKIDIVFILLVFALFR